MGVRGCGTSRSITAINRHPVVIERFSDGDLAQDYGIDTGKSAQKLFGARGDAFTSDPGRLLHQGARCSTPRLVMFITFTSRAPMSYGRPLTIAGDERRRLGRALFAACPDTILPPSAFA